MSVARRCADCGRPLVHEADPVVEGKPRPRALLGVSVVVDYGPPGDGRAGGDLELCLDCGGSAEIARGLALGRSPEATPVIPIKQPGGGGGGGRKPPPKPAPQRPRKTFT